MIPLTIVTVDGSLITNTLIAGAALMVFGFVGGYIIARKMAGPIANMIAKSRRKRTPLMLQRTLNKTFKLFPVKRDGNYVWVDSTKVYVEPDAVHPFIGSAPLIISHTLDAGELKPEFIKYASLFANAAGRTLSLVEVYRRLEAIKANLESLMADRDITERALSDFQTELFNVNKALEISEGKVWKTERSEDDGTMKRLYTEETLTSDDLTELAPVGNGIDDLETVIRRNEAAAVKDSAFNPATGIRYIVLGVVIFIVLLGIRITFLG